MRINLRSALYAFYRKLFTGVFLLTGIASATLAILENLIGITTLFTDSVIEQEAIYNISIMVGLVSFITAFLLVYLSRDRRTGSNRRYLDQSSYPGDRRRNTDRRAASVMSNF